MFLHMRDKLAVSLAHIGAGTRRPRDAIPDISSPLRCKEVPHIYQYLPEKFSWLVGDAEVTGA